MPALTTFRSPVLSLWQSAIDEVLARAPSSGRALQGARGNLRADTALMQQAITAAERVLRPDAARATPTLTGVITDCAELYVQLILAEARGDAAQVAALANQIPFSNCDPLWAEVFLTYEHYRLAGATIPYRPYQQLDDYILPLPGAPNAPVRIALLADWGTGTPAATALLADIARQRPDVLIHLGDIYYSGTQREVQERFLAICRATPGLAIPIYTLAGNHDMYAGGGGYYWLLDQLQQPASYFCLRNDAWQILAMDTGLHDSDPGSVVSNVTALDPQEAVWQRDKLRHAGGRRTVLLSHHQLLSAVDGVGMTSGGQVLAVNPHLYAVFSDLLEDVAWWLWGHEHNLISFAPYMGLMRGRCIGSAAVPKLVDEQPYTPNPALVVPSGQREPPQMDPQVALGTDGRFYRHAYAVLTLQGRAATMTYYEMTDAGSRILFTEGVAA